MWEVQMRLANETDWKNCIETMEGKPVSFDVEDHAKTVLHRSAQTVNLRQDAFYRIQKV